MVRSVGSLGTEHQVLQAFAQLSPSLRFSCAISMTWHVSQRADMDCVSLSCSQTMSSRSLCLSQLFWLPPAFSTCSNFPPSLSLPLSLLPSLPLPLLMGSIFLKHANTPTLPVANLDLQSFLSLVPPILLLPGLLS